MLMRLDISRRRQPNIGKNQQAQDTLVRLVQLQGTVRQLDVRIWQVFPETDVRAHFGKLIRRFEIVEDFLQQPDLPALEQAAEAMDWLSSQLQEVAKYTAYAAGLDLAQKERFVFVGFRRVTKEALRRFVPEDDPPPWLLKP